MMSSHHGNILWQLSLFFSSSCSAAETGIGLRYDAAEGVASQSNSLNVFLSETHKGFCKSAEFSIGDLQKLLCLEIILPPLPRTYIFHFMA